MKKAILYLNQFFGQIGGEELADHAPEIREGLVGPAMELQKQLGEDVQVTHTIICGDNFMGSRTQEALDTILGFLADKEFDIFFAGPAFRAGRYGSACGNICKAVKDKFGVPVITSMNDENPGVDMFKKEMYIFTGGASAAAMRKDVAAMAKFGLKVLKGEEVLPAEVEGYYGRGIRSQIWLNPPVNAADRVIDMLLKKIHGQPFQTELPIPKADLVPIAPALTPEELSKTKVALVTSGGIVPVGNPDRIQSASATKWGKYDISQLDDLKAGEFMTIHAGYDPAAANADADVCVPLDALRAYEKEGRIGGVYQYFYATVGTGTTQAEAARMGKEIAAELIAAGVKAVILTST
ncbi:glycine reductase [Anaerosolibacter carboniphilus]|uniref:Glycine reductase n=3 Tax=Anaerosolibacter carboniphilus TaxID=1417629 RepID=A0A841KXV4_9FIRM|nr:glycine reductase [Anaerosolibacter carboniphilus]